MSKAPLVPTPANVSRILTIAGHPKRKPYTSRIRGMPNYSSGFHCTDRDGCVVVRHRTAGYSPAPASALRSRVESYLPALTERFQCELIESPPGEFSIMVRQRTEPTP